MDVAWLNNQRFVLAERKLYLHDVASEEPVMTFEGHNTSIHCIKWDPSGSLLASCCDDPTAKVRHGSSHFTLQDMESSL